MRGVVGRGEMEIDDWVVYENPEGVRVEEMERMFEVTQVNVMKYEEKGFDVLVVGVLMQELGWG